MCNRENVHLGENKVKWHIIQLQTERVHSVLAAHPHVLIKYVNRKGYNDYTQLPHPHLGNRNKLNLVIQIFTGHPDATQNSKSVLPIE